jgi:hypothetical protein
MTKPEQPRPQIINGNKSPQIDASDVAETMQELDISDQGINNTSIYIDPKNRLLNLGTHYPNRLGRLRFRSIPELRHAQGDIVRISTKVKGKERTAEQMNHTLVHELEHVAQQDRHDIKLHEGHLAIWGLAAVGAVIGNKLGKRTGSKAAHATAVAVGAVVGQQAGYLLAPHERQARQQAKAITSKAITR